MVTPGGLTRPTIAYVAGLDGMLHAFVAQAGSVAGTGGTFVSGDELWAFIPPSQLNNIAGRTAILDGSPQVADVNVDYGTGKKWETVLAITGGFDTPLGSGTVDLLDISDPINPVFRWEASDTNTVGGNTYIMGRAQGAAIQPALTAAGLKYAVFLATDNANGTWGNGFNMYSLDAKDGSVLWRFNHTYTFDTSHDDVPATVSAIDTSGNNGAANAVFFGDIEGRVWQIPTAGAVGSPLPIFDGPASYAIPSNINFPIESAVALYRDPNNADLSLIGVTGGADWVIASGQQSKIFKLDLKNLPPTLTTIASLTDRVFAVPTIAGQSAYFITSGAGLQGGNSSTYNATGSLHRIDLVTNTDTSVVNLKQGASEVAVDASGKVYVASAIGITVNANAGADASQTTYSLQNHPLAKPITNQAWLDFR